MLFLFFFSCEQADLILDKLSEDAPSSFSTSEVNTISDESTIEEGNNQPDDENQDQENQDQENWDWGEDTSEGMTSFEGTFEGTFEMYNVQTNHLLCLTEGIFVHVNENVNLPTNTITSSIPCTTPNGHQLSIFFEGEFLDLETESYQDAYYAYAQSQGSVLVEVPSGDLFESTFYGESHMEGDYVWNYLQFEIEILTPNGSRYYFGSLYTY